MTRNPRLTWGRAGRVRADEIAQQLASNNESAALWTLADAVNAAIRHSVGNGHREAPAEWQQEARRAALRLLAALDRDYDRYDELCRR